MHYLETLELGVEGEDEEGGLEHHQQGEKAHHGSGYGRSGYFLTIKSFV